MELERELQQDFARKNKTTNPPLIVDGRVLQRCKVIFGIGLIGGLCVLFLPQPGHFIPASERLPLPGQTNTHVDRKKLADGSAFTSPSSASSSQDNTKQFERESGVALNEVVAKSGDESMATSANPPRGGVTPSKVATETLNEAEVRDFCLPSYAYHKGEMLNQKTNVVSPQLCHAECAKLDDCSFWDFGESFCRLRRDAGIGGIRSFGYVGGKKSCRFKPPQSPVQARIVSCPA